MNAKQQVKFSCLLIWACIGLGALAVLLSQILGGMAAYYLMDVGAGSACIGVLVGWCWGAVASSRLRRAEPSEDGHQQLSESPRAPFSTPLLITLALVAVILVFLVVAIAVNLGPRLGP